MKVLVAGGRFYDNWRHVEGMLDLINGMYGPITCVVTGACCTREGAPRGADWWAERWARKRELRYVGLPAQFTKLGRPAGPIRNRLMMSEERPDIVLAVPGNDGTADMIEAAEEFGLRRRGKDGHDGTAILLADTVPDPKPIDWNAFTAASSGD